MKENSIQLGNLTYLAANQLTGYEKLIYEVLVLMEQKIGWTQLIKIRNQVFLERNEVPLGEVSGHTRRRKSYIPKEKAESSGEESKNPRSESNERESDSDERKSLDKSPGNKRESINLGKRSVFHKNEGAKDEEEGNTIRLIKRVCEKLDNALACLNDDLTAYRYWEMEELKKDDTLGNLYNTIST